MPKRSIEYGRQEQQHRYRRRGDAPGDTDALVEALKCFWCKTVIEAPRSQGTKAPGR